MLPSLHLKTADVGVRGNWRTILEEGSKENGWEERLKAMVDRSEKDEEKKMMENVTMSDMVNLLTAVIEKQEKVINELGNEEDPSVEDLKRQLEECKNNLLELQPDEKWFWQRWFSQSTSRDV